MRQTKDKLTTNLLDPFYPMQLGVQFERRLEMLN